MSWVYFINDIHPGPAPEVGGKFANLQRLAHLCLIPEGFCLPTQHYQKWRQLAENSRPGMIAALKDRLSPLIEQMFKDRSDAVAVRSSAVDEDGKDNSFAGQYDTFLNVRGVDAITDKIVSCWEGAQSLAVQSYREERGQSCENTGLAVVVQRLIPADTAGVAFSLDPITGRNDRITINSNWGLGKSVVDGLTNPDMFSVIKTPLNVTSRQCGDKKVMTLPEKHGTRESKVPALLRRQFSLSDSQVLEIAKLVQLMEDTFLHPVDIEWAFHNDKLYLLQCRPVTT